MKKLIVISILILLIGGYLIKTSYNLDFDESQDKKTFVKTFTSWISKLFSNLKSITTYAVKQDWSTPTPNTTQTSND